MKGQVQTEHLRNDLNKILSVVDKKNSRPILSYTLFKAEKNSIEFSATNLEVSAKVVIPAIVENSGTFCVNAKNIFDIVRELPDGDIFFEMKEGTNFLNLSCNNIHYSLLVYNFEDFPQLTFSKQENEFSMGSDQLLEVINKTSHAISSDETRLYLNGIYLQGIDSRIRAVATDGHRLSLLETEPLENCSDIEPLLNGIIIPRKGVFELKKIAESFPGKALKISFDESFMYINAKDKYFLSIRLIARDYPKYQAVIPNKTSFTLSADKDALFGAIKRIKIMSHEKSNGVRIKLKKNSMTISANHPSFGEASEDIPVEYDGKEMEIGFNARYLLDTLATFNEGKIILELNNELSPIIIKSSNSPNYLGIIMPLKL
ncbi:MAG: DNA polymerase III subunit beta [Deltaproteobacteria bacterium]|nr:MAG: DNA polymerase III subunit beta [Deltaproteobacteria bacterium]